MTRADKAPYTRNMSRSAVTLVTCTYNDARLCHGLLASLADWSLAPDRVLVVDDGSAEPFAAPDGNPARVLRLEPNRGPARAKQAGIDGADTDLVLCVDCDIRPHPDWLARCLETALDPAVGLVGGHVAAPLGDDLAGRWLQRFRIGYRDPADPPFIGGELFLLRKAVWDELRGFQGLAGATHEDFFFSRKVAKAGYRLRVCDGPEAVEARRLSRTALASRLVHYSLAPLLGVFRQRGLNALMGQLTETAERIGAIAQSGDTALVYVELLVLAAKCLWLLDRGVDLGGGPGRDRPALCAALARLLGPFPRLAGLLSRDLGALGLPLELKDCEGRIPFWDELFRLFAPYGDTAMLAWLDTHGAAAILEEEARARYDFHYIGLGNRPPA